MFLKYQWSRHKCDFKLEYENTLFYNSRWCCDQDVGTHSKAAQTDEGKTLQAYIKKSKMILEHPVNDGDLDQS